MKKKAKKLACLLVALMLVVGAAGSAYAEGENTSSNVEKSDVATYISVAGYKTEATTVESTISVTIEWDPIVFEYREKQKGEWNPQKHVYEGGWDAGWVAKNNLVTVSNHSDVAVRVGFDFAPNENLVTDLQSQYYAQETVDGNVTKNLIQEDSTGYGFVSLNEGTVDENGSPVTDVKQVALELQGGVLNSYFSNNPNSQSQLGQIVIYVMK